MNEQSNIIDIMAGQASVAPSVAVGIVCRNIWEVECRDKFGRLKWTDRFKNLITTEGLNDALTQYFKGAAYTAAHYVGLTDGTPTAAAGDTMGSHTGWAEVTAYDEAARPDYTPGAVAAGSVDNSASKASFTVSAGATTIGGMFLVTVATKGGTTGTLYAVGAFTGGDRTLGAGDTLAVTLTATQTSS